LPFPPLSVVEDALNSLAQQRELRNIVIEKELPPELPLARGDGGQLRQAFLNILVNAVEAMPDGGTLRVSHRKPDPSSLSLTFTDTGAGIPDEQLGKVSDPFYSLKQKSGNIGLGLSIARGIVEGHGGTLKIESAEGEGTRVTVVLLTA
jgi:signal transduction histidine kinase